MGQWDTDTALPMARRDVLRLLGLAGLGAAALGSVRTTALAGTASFLDRESFLSAIQSLISHAASNELEDVALFRLQGEDLPWKDLELDARAGQSVTFLLGGRLWLSREHDLWVEPGTSFHVRSKAGQPMYNPMINHGTMTVEHDGPLEIARSLAEWENADGELWTPPEVYTQTDVDIYGVALRWKGDAATGLRTLLRHGDVGGVLRRELDRLDTSAGVPPGWDNHFNAGGDDVIFRTGGDGEIVCRSHKTGGLLRHPAPMPLVPGTILSWRWIVEELPSPINEDQLIGHDYLSIGVEFDDGQDLTYLWSRGLPVESAFRCPIPRWTPIETHLVVRSGFDDIGQWLDESRDVHADYHAHVGGEAREIVRVWLLAVTIFQRRSGACRYAAIQLSGPDKQLQIL